MHVESYMYDSAFTTRHFRRREVVLSIEANVDQKSMGQVRTANAKYWKSVENKEGYESYGPQYKRWVDLATAD